MLLRMAIRLVLLAVIFAIVAQIVPGINVHGGFLALLWIALLFSIINIILGPLFRLLSLPLIVLTLGLFLLVVNAALLGLTAWLSSHLSINTFWDALLGAILITIFSWIAELLVPLRPRHD